MERTLVITGKGKLSVNPDLAIIKFPVSTQDMDYGTTVNELNILVERLRVAIESLGIERKELKTEDFRVITLNRWNKKTEQNEFLGYQTQHDLILEVPFNNSLVNKIVSNVVKLDSSIRFNIRFGVQDKGSCLQSLIENAIINAKEKAKIISAASDVSLKEILNINYSFSDVYFHSNTLYESNALMCSETSAPDITPSDIDMAENVTITWRIE